MVSAVRWDSLTGGFRAPDLEVFEIIIISHNINNTTGFRFRSEFKLYKR